MLPPHAGMHSIVDIGVVVQRRLALLIEKLNVAPDMLGESPVWDPDAATLYWIDTVSRKVRSWHPASGREHVWTTPSMVSTLRRRLRFKDSQAWRKTSRSIKSYQLSVFSCQ